MSTLVTVPANPDHVRLVVHVPLNFEPVAVRVAELGAAVTVTLVDLLFVPPTLSVTRSVTV
jgi:hypothetical protein